MNVAIRSFICIDCAKVHHELFSQYNKSICESIHPIDHSFTLEEICRVQNSSNEIVNSHYLVLSGKDFLTFRPNSNSSQKKRKVWIYKKYIEKAWYSSNPNRRRSQRRTNNIPESSAVSTSSSKVSSECSHTHTSRHNGMRYSIKQETPVPARHRPSVVSAASAPANHMRQRLSVVSAASAPANHTIYENRYQNQQPNSHPMKQRPAVVSATSAPTKHTMHDNRYPNQNPSSFPVRKRPSAVSPTAVPIQNTARKYHAKMSTDDKDPKQDIGGSMHSRNSRSTARSKLMNHNHSNHNRVNIDGVSKQEMGGSLHSRGSLRPKSLASDTHLSEALVKTCRIPSNKRCADCTIKDPQYVNLTFGTFICAICATVHEEMGHDTRLINSKNLKLADVIRITHVNGGNENNNSRYLFHYDPTLERLSPPTPGSSISKRKEWIHMKYVEKCWYKTKRRMQNVDMTLTPNEPRSRQNTNRTQVFYNDGSTAGGILHQDRLLSGHSAKKSRGTTHREDAIFSKPHLNRYTNAYTYQARNVRIAPSAFPIAA